MGLEGIMLKYLPATFGLAVLLIASTALAEERSAQKQFVNHNDSMMVLQIGDALGGVSTTLNIHYENPSERMSQLVHRGDLFFDGSIQWDTRKVIGNARVYKWGCEALEYQVKGILSEQGNAISTLELEGWTPTFGRGCEFEEFVWNHNSSEASPQTDESCIVPLT